MLWKDLNVEERRTIVRQHDLDGKTPSQTARELGCSISCISGFRHRLKMPNLPKHRPPKKEPKPEPKPRVAPPRPVAPPRLPMVRAAKVPEGDGPGVAFLERGALQCAFVRADKGPDGETRCCGAPVETVRGKLTSWCGMHRAHLFECRS